MRTKRINILIFLLMGMVMSLSAQTFQATDIVFAQDIDESERQYMRNKVLGQELRITTFDNDLKVEGVSKDGQSQKEPMIFHLQSDGNYKFTHRNDTMIIIINKILGYYKSIKYEVWRDNEYQWTVIMKRK